MTNQKETENSPIPTATSTKAPGNKANQPMAPTPTKTEQSTKANLKTIKSTAKEQKPGPTDPPTRASTCTTIRMGLEGMNGRMETRMRVTGAKTSYVGRESTHTRMVGSSWDSLRMI